MVFMVFFVTFIKKKFMWWAIEFYYNVIFVKKKLIQLIVQIIIINDFEKENFRTWTKLKIL